MTVLHLWWKSGRWFVQADQYQEHLRGVSDLSKHHFQADVFDEKCRIARKRFLQDQHHEDRYSKSQTGIQAGTEEGAMADMNVAGAE